MKLLRKLGLLVHLFFLAAILCPRLYALQVKQIDPQTGALILDDSRRVVLAGITPAPYAYNTLAVILSKKDIELEEEKSLTNDSSIPAVYLWLHAAEIDLPFRPNSPARDTKLMLNELLLNLGIASVDPGVEFKFKDKFLKAEIEAKLLGKGIWSFEPPQIKKKT